MHSNVTRFERKINRNSSHPDAGHANTGTQRLAPSRIQPTTTTSLHPAAPSYNQWQYAWSTNCSATPSASRGGPHRKRTHAAPCAALAHTPQTGRGTAPRRPFRRPTTAAPRALPRATGGTLHAAAARGPGVQPLEHRADLALRRPSPRPQIDQHRVRARRAVEGAHAAQHARRGGERAQPARLV